MKFEKGNKAAKGGLRNPPGGRPTTEQQVAKEELLHSALDALKLSMFKAVSTLVRHLDSEAENISLRAAESIISFTQKAIQHEELEKRIQALEEKLIQQGGSR
jgi:hypothetical protein